MTQPEPRALDRHGWPTGWWRIYYWCQAGFFAGIFGDIWWPFGVLILAWAIVLPPVVHRLIVGGEE